MSLNNEDNMSAVRAAMNAKKEEKKLQTTANQVNAGSKHTTLVHVDYISDEDNHYEGDFVFRKPGIIDYITISAQQAKYFERQGVEDLGLVPQVARMYAHMLATLKVVVVKCPEWFLDSENLQEPDVLTHVYGEFSDWTDSFRKTSDDTNSGDGQTSEGAASVGVSEAVQYAADGPEIPSAD